MLFSLRHGSNLQWVSGGTPPTDAATTFADRSRRTAPDVVPAEAAVPGILGRQANTLAIDAVDAQLSVAEPFEYLFPDAPTLAAKDKAAQLNALAAAMIEGDAPETEAGIPAVFTYLGQFIDHDMTAGTNTDEVAEGLKVKAATIVPQSRQLVREALRNMRKGSLQLDSLYGDGPVSSAENARLQAAMRDPVNPDKMLLGELVRLEGAVPPIQRIAPAEDNLFDLPRIGALVGPGKPFADKDDLPQLLQPKAGDATENWKRRAFIGDSRNDENLIVAQTHLAFLRLHNSFVDRGMGFVAARQATVFHYQWLVVNSYLVEVCDPATLSSVVEDKAPLYTAFLERLKPSLPFGVLPVPIEFSVAAFRFGHSMVRGVYDYNANFPGATLDQLFEFTGGGENPIGGERFKLEALPDNWPIDWSRFLVRTPGRRARPIDTGLASPLGNMINEGSNPAEDPPEAEDVFKKLAVRNLRRGHVLNVPSAQSVIAALKGLGLDPGAELTPTQLTSGVTGEAIQAGDFVNETPLWFYVLKEAEVLGNGRLGPVGSRLVAETIHGLIVHDPNSYLNRAGTPWHPNLAATDGNEPITSLQALFTAAGTMF